jgi:hypothetical protein
MLAVLNCRGVFPGGRMLAKVIWGKNIKRGEDIKGENVKEKEE